MGRSWWCDITLFSFKNLHPQYAKQSFLSRAKAIDKTYSIILRRVTYCSLHSIVMTSASHYSLKTSRAFSFFHRAEADNNTAVVATTGIVFSSHGDERNKWNHPISFVLFRIYSSHEQISDEISILPKLSCQIR